MKEIVKKYAQKYPLSTTITVVVWLLSLLPYFPETALNDVPFIDKWTHFLMYGTLCTAIWGEYWWKHRRPDYEKLFFGAWLTPVVMSGVLELLQEYATPTRHGEWTDFLANATGVTIGAVIGLLFVLCFPKR